MRNCFCITISSGRIAVRVTAMLLLLAALLTGCTDLFFYPMRQQVLDPSKMGLAKSDVALTAADGTQLLAWHLAAERPRGVICFFHGNAENISTHIVNVAWLPEAGYDVLLVDYRGYGASQGRAEFPEVLADVRAGLDWCVARGGAAGVPVYALGQSLGAALLLDAVAADPYRDELAAVVADSGFSGYRRIVRDVLSESWLLWPFRYPVSWLVTGSHDPEHAVRGLGGLPLLVMHSRDDEVVPWAHGVRIFSAARGPRCFLPTAGPHNAALGPRSAQRDEWRAALLVFLQAAHDARISGAVFGCRAPLLDQAPGQ